MTAPVDLTGKRFGKLTCIRPTGEVKARSRLWLCRCDCGNEVIRKAMQFAPSQQASAGVSQCNECFRKACAKRMIFLRLNPIVRVEKTCRKCGLLFDGSTTEMQGKSRCPSCRKAKTDAIHAGVLHMAEHGNEKRKRLATLILEGLSVEAAARKCGITKQRAFQMIHGNRGHSRPQEPIFASANC
jgi:hypothetical protein